MAQRASLTSSVRPMHGILPHATSVYSQRFVFGGTGLERSKENFGPRGSTDLSPIDSEDEEEANESFTPINARTWAREPPPSVVTRSGMLQPMPRKPFPRQSTTQTLRDAPDVLPPPQGRDRGVASSSQGLVAPDCDRFLEMMDEKLRIGGAARWQTSAAGTGAGTEVESGPHARSTSSSYPSPGDTCTRVQSPDSMVRQNRLSVTDLARITQANGRFSILRSSSSLSEQQYQQQLQEQSRTRGDRDVLTESSSAIAQWQTEPRQGSQTRLPDDLAPGAERLLFSPSGQHTSPSSILSPPRGLASQSLTWDTIRAIRAQYDGTQDLTHPALRPDPLFSSPAPDVVPSFAQKHHLDHDLHDHNHDHDHDQHDHHCRGNKRKASLFSLRSLNSLKSLTKRPRLGLRRWANSVYEHGSHRLRVARQKFREHAEMDRRAFEAWRARRRQHAGHGEEGSSPGASSGDAGIPASKSCGAMCPQRKNEEWWKDGVSRFEAHKWLSFLPGANSAPTLKA